MTIHRYEAITKATPINFTSTFWSLHHLFDWMLKNSSCSIETALHCWRPPSVYSYTKLLSTYQCIRSWEGYKCNDTIHGPHQPEAHHLWPLIAKSQYYRNIKSQKKLSFIEATQHFSTTHTSVPDTCMSHQYWWACHRLGDMSNSQVSYLSGKLPFFPTQGNLPKCKSVTTKLLLG